MQTTIEAGDVAAVRKELDMSQLAFATLLGVSVRTVRGWEAGAVIPDSAKFTLRLVRHCLSFGDPTLIKWTGALRELLGGLGK